ncbi:hypothetical protein CsSME_00048184 [Camellia sinensis var. sinensis]
MSSEPPVLIYSSPIEKTMNPEPQVPVDFMEDSDQIPRSEKLKAKKCDFFTGDWIPNPFGPVYNNESCHLIECHQNCLKNGRPNTWYLYWRWNPRDCELSQFDLEKFLELIRDKTWALIGDSISRNHVQSLFCLLSKVNVRIAKFGVVFGRLNRIFTLFFTLFVCPIYNISIL